MIFCSIVLLNLLICSINTITTKTNATKTNTTKTNTTKTNTTKKNATNITDTSNPFDYQYVLLPNFSSSDQLDDFDCKYLYVNPLCPE